MEKKVIISEEAVSIMEERGIKEEDIIEGIGSAEATGGKLYVEGEKYLLAKAIIGNYTLYVEYEEEADSVLVTNVYGHMVSIVEHEE